MATAIIRQEILSKFMKEPEPLSEPNWPKGAKRTIVESLLREGLLEIVPPESGRNKKPRAHISEAGKKEYLKNLGPFPLTGRQNSDKLAMQIMVCLQTNPGPIELTHLIKDLDQEKPIGSDSSRVDHSIFKRLENRGFVRLFPSQLRENNPKMIEPSLLGTRIVDTIKANLAHTETLARIDEQRIAYVQALEVMNQREARVGSAGWATRAGIYTESAPKPRAK